MLKKQKTEKNSQATDLADKLRQTRKSLKLTMQYVADEAGLSVGFMSQVERGITVPSLSSLVSIAKVLQKPVGFFLENQIESREMTRQDDRRPFEVVEGTIYYERLSANFANSALKSVIVHEPPGHRMEPISHEGEELFYILSGEITIEIDGQTSTLRAGDSVHFNSRRTHSSWNHTTEFATLLWCGTMDIFGDGDPNPTHRN